MRLPAKIGIAVAMSAAMLAPAAPALAWPNSVYLATTATQTGAVYYSGTGSVRAWQYCESSNGQTNWYNTGPWRGAGVYSWTGTCTWIRDRGFDVRNW